MSFGTTYTELESLIYLFLLTKKFAHLTQSETALKSFSNTCKKILAPVLIKDRPYRAVVIVIETKWSGSLPSKIICCNRSTVDGEKNCLPVSLFTRTVNDLND